MKQLKQFILSILCISMSITLIHPIRIHAIDEFIPIGEEPTTKTEAFVLEEDGSQRTESSKDFIMSDKSTQKIIYSIPVHYEEDGEWKEIDNTLIDDEIATIDDESDEVVGYETNKSKTKIKFAKKLHKKNLGSIKLDDYKIMWGLENFDNKSEAQILSKEEQKDPRLKIYDNISQTILYEDISENISLQYSIDSLKIKEDIIIKDKVDNHIFRFNYKVKNLTLTLNDNGEIEAKDSSTDEVIFIMPKPYMKDGNDDISEDVFYTLTQENENKYTITYGYDDLNRLSSRSLNTTNPITSTYEYADSLREGDYSTNKISTETIGDTTYQYSYDNLGNITEIKSTKGNTEKTINYTYDSLSRLIKEKNQLINKTIYYTYDENGNITSKKEYDYSENTLISTKSYTYEVSGWNDQLKVYNEENISYDDIGNPTTYRNNEMEWEGRELITYDTQDNRISYVYGSDGYRNKKIIEEENLLTAYTGDDKENWICQQAFEYTSYTVTSSTEAAHKGNTSFKVKSNSSTATAYSRMYKDYGLATIKPNTTYTASQYVHVSDLTATDDIYGAVLMVYLDAPSLAGKSERYVTSRYITETDGQWVKQSVTFTTPSDINFVRFSSGLISSVGTAYFDDLSMAEAEVREYDYIDGKVVEERGNEETLRYTYDDKGNLTKISHIKNNTTTDYYVVTNSRGDIEQIYNSNGALQCRYIYDSWGNTVRIVDSNNNDITNSNHIGHINPIRYRGYYYDKESRLYYLNSRYYDSEVSRFINADDIAVVSLEPSSLYDKNLYAYCDNNPICRTDNSGYLWSIDRWIINF